MTTRRTPSSDTRFGRLAAHWVYGGVLAGGLLLVLTPLIATHWPRSGLLVWLCLPIYMLHQYEEHDADRFRSFVNDRLADGVEALTVPAVFWINIVGVWAVIAAALWLSLRVHPGWGLVAAYLLLVNALAHGGQALVLRSPNPGLWTGLALFLPLGAVLWWHLWPQASPLQHLLSIALVALIHAAIFAGVARARKAGHR